MKLIIILFSFIYSFDSLAATITISNAGGNWSSVGTWNGGVIPGSTDAIVAASSSGNLTVDVASHAASVDFTNYTHTLTMNATLQVEGTFKLVAGMTVSGTSDLIIHAAATITSAGKTWTGGIQYTGAAATVTLGDNWTITGSLTQSSSGTLTMNSNTMNVQGSVTQTTSQIYSGSTIIAMTGTGTLSNSSGGGSIRNSMTFNTAGTITISGIIIYGTGTITYIAGTVTTTGSTLTLSGGTTATLNTNGMSWNNINLQSGFTYTLNSTCTVSGTVNLNNTSGTVTFAGSAGFSTNTFTSLTANNAWTINLVNAVTYVVTNNLVIHGFGNNHTIIKSTSAGNRASLTVQSAATQDVSFVDATDIDSGGGQQICDYRGVSPSNCLNWASIVLPTTITSQIGQ